MFLENRASKEAGISIHTIYWVFQTVIPLIGCRVQVNKTQAAIGNISYLELKVYFQENIKGEAIDVAQCLKVVTALTKKRDSVSSITSVSSQIPLTPITGNKATYFLGTNHV